MLYTVAIVLFGFAFTARLRFRYHHSLFLFLQHTRNTQVIFVLLFSIYFISLFCHFSPQNYFNTPSFIILSIIFPCVVFYMTFANLRCKESGLLLTAFRNLRIDIQPKYLPDETSKKEYVSALVRLVDNIVVLQALPFQKIYFSSHLIRVQGKNFLKKEFRKRKIPCYCKAYKLCWSEVAVLNFRYGGRTRFCLFSHKLHTNGVKIGRTGHAFAIKKRSIKNINSASPEE